MITVCSDDFSDPAVGGFCIQFTHAQHLCSQQSGVLFIRCCDEQPVMKFFKPDREPQVKIVMIVQEHSSMAIPY